MGGLGDYWDVVRDEVGCYFCGGRSVDCCWLAGFVEGLFDSWVLAVAFAVSMYVLVSWGGSGGDVQVVEWNIPMAV